jgi:glutaredoxin-related protein
VNRSEKIDEAVCAAGELISALEQVGLINSAQARILVHAAVRAAVPNFKDWEARDSATRIMADLEK